MRRRPQHATWISPQIENGNHGATPQHFLARKNSHHTRSLYLLFHRARELDGRRSLDAVSPRTLIKTTTAVCTILVYTILVKNITLSADENLIEQARKAAADQNTTLNAAFREWLEQYSGRARWLQEYDAIMERTKYVKADRKYTREELNEQ